MYYARKSKASSSRGPQTDAIRLNPHTQRNIEELLKSMKPTYTRPSSESNMYDGIDSKLKARYDHINDSDFKKAFLEIVVGDIQQNLTKSMLAKSKLIENDDCDLKTLQEHKERIRSPGYQKMLKFREKLPAYKMKREILNLIKRNQVVVISGETGTIFH